MGAFRQFSTMYTISDRYTGPVPLLRSVGVIRWYGELSNRVFAGNILILGGNINIQPKSRTTVSYEFLSQLVAEYLLKNSPDVDVSAALSIMPHTQSELRSLSVIQPLMGYFTEGMDLNPLFTSSTSFRPSTALKGGELKLFEQVGIPLIHGWLVDPEGVEAPAIQRVKDYDSAVQLIAEVDHLTNGKFVVDDSAPSTSPDGATSPAREWTPKEMQKVEDGMSNVQRAGLCAHLIHRMHF